MLNPFYTGVAIIERSLSDEKNGQISQQSFKDHPAITQWSTRFLNDRPVISTVATGSAKFWLSPKQSLNDCQGKRSLNESTMNTQQTLNDLIDLSMIPQWSFNEHQICPPRRRHGWKINEHTRISHRTGFFRCFWEIVERSGLFLIAQWSPNNLCTV